MHLTARRPRQLPGAHPAQHGTIRPAQVNVPMAPRQQNSPDWESELGTLAELMVTNNVRDAPISALHRQLHPVSRNLRTRARATIRHLSLSRYAHGRLAAQRVVTEAGDAVTPSMAAAAAAPPLPWDLLAATPSLTSLEIRSDQLGQLMEGAGGAAVAAEAALAAATATSSVAAAAPAAAAVAGPGVLATTLGRLRCLRVVTGINSEQQVAHLGRLLACTTQLTRLVVKGSKEPVWVRRWIGHPCVHGQRSAYTTCRALLEAMEAAPHSNPADAAGATGTQAGAASAAAAEAGHGRSSARLPPLQHLVVEGPVCGLVPAWLQQPQAATKLKSLHLIETRLRLELLSSASGLQELTLENCAVGYGAGHSTATPLPPDLTCLTALTRLVVWGTDTDAVPPVVWRLTTLHHLSLGHRYGGADGVLPNSISSLQQLRRLELNMAPLSQLPADLGTWLPQLLELDVSGTRVSDLPRSLTRLTRLAASGTRVTQVSAVAHLVTLKQLCMEQSVLCMPLQPLSELSALEGLWLGWSKRLAGEEATQLHLPGPLPALQSFSVKGPLRVDQVQEVVAGAQQLTRLALTINLGPEEVAALGQLGVLPHLKRLELSRSSGSTRWAAAAPWLQQQPYLTSLKLSKGEAEGPLLPQLPAQLEDLNMRWSTLGVEQPTALTQLSRLRKLSITCHDNLVPSWLSGLCSLEVLEVAGWKVYHGWEVLAQLPLLRQVRVEEQSLVHALRHAPHLCWALPVADN